ncbi:hypothetical protein [Archaeoglobus veneficus]|uniref:Uncharacterized protein n=1 Tax=Archaeoglobus veneficus (strain DSM 11195 / SNP6) TaxID=693661 RepID=F2KQC5_ARCVS|nr:hypothetical protein [Archaeoglobus veneficus]AEA46558.1 hypothetical protein Arcve_0531 [Archaeoglobus veneficus SNP6]
MGMYDTIYLDRPYTCPVCGEKIRSVQTKAFENMLESFCVGDCVGHAEEIEIVKEELFCSNCSKSVLSVYIVVCRGILLGITDTLEEARNLLNSLNLEKLVFMYHDLYQKYIRERNERHSCEKFLEDLREWYGERLYERPKAEIWFIWNLRHLKGAVNPIESIERFMTSKKMRRALNELWEEGYETLDIYYPEEVAPGEDAWSVDVYQDDLNERCRLNWTWTVMSKKQLEIDGGKEDELPEWVIVVDEQFSDEVVCKAVEKWLRSRGYGFRVRMIPFERARGSGLVKKLREAEKEDKVPLESAIRELEREENKRLADFIDARKDRKKVFYYDGFYGSLVADVESDRLLGKIEGIDEDIIYEGKTVRECEKKFREAVSRYKKLRGTGVS